MTRKPPVSITPDLIAEVCRLAATMKYSDAAAAAGCSMTTAQKILKAHPIAGRPKHITQPLKTGRAQRERDRRRYTKAEVADFTAKIIAALADGDKPANQIAPVVGLNSYAMEQLLRQLEIAGTVEKSGYLTRHGTAGVAVWSLAKPTASVEPVYAPPIPFPVYESLSAAILGDPPLGRRAIDQRAAG
jgi:hypothetical protein